MQVIKQDQVQEKIVIIRNQKVIVDTDVAELYGVETKRINEAVKNNPEKFPKGYLFGLNKQEKDELVENFDRFRKLKHGNTRPGKMTATLERSDTTIVVKQVPADVCDNCGEEYLSQEISAQLLKQAEEAVKAGIQVDVRKYKSAA